MFTLIDDFHDAQFSIAKCESKAMLNNLGYSIANVEIWTIEEEASRLGKRLQGINKAEFARLHKIPGGASMVSQHISGIRPMSLKAAVAYAKAFGCGLADISPRLASQMEQANTVMSMSEPGSEYVVDRSNLVEIMQYNDHGGAMGNGLLLKDQPGQITSWQVTREWAERNLPPNTGMQNLCIVTGFGDSMKGMYNSGDPLIVDTGVRACEYDGVYFFRVGNEGFIKRLQRIPGQGILVISKNTEYRDWVITEDMDFEVFGRVLRVWKGENY